jgi:hypothetical protein
LKKNNVKLAMLNQATNLLNHMDQSLLNLSDSLDHLDQDLLDLSDSLDQPFNNHLCKENAERTGSGDQDTVLGDEDDGDHPRDTHAQPEHTATHTLASTFKIQQAAGTQSQALANFSSAERQPKTTTSRLNKETQVAPVSLLKWFTWKTSWGQWLRV